MIDSILHLLKSKQKFELGLKLAFKFESVFYDYFKTSPFSFKEGVKYLIEMKYFKYGEDFENNIWYKNIEINDKCPKDLSFLNCFKNIYSLFITGNITEYTCNEKLKYIEKVYIKHNNNIGDFVDCLDVNVCNNFSFVDSNISKIPTQIFKLKKLESLTLSYNKIDTFPNELSKLKKLKYLDLTDNNLSNINFEKGFNKLEKLYIQKNKIQNLDNSFFNLPKINAIILPKEHIRINNINSKLNIYYA